MKADSLAMMLASVINHRGTQREVCVARLDEDCKEEIVEIIDVRFSEQHQCILIVTEEGRNDLS